MKLQLLGFVALSGLQLAFMNATWQQAKLSDSGAVLAVSGFDVASQLTLVIILQLLALFGARYWRPAVAFLATAFTTLLSAMLLWSTSAAVFGQRHWLESAIATKTGIADWSSQLSSITDLSTDGFAPNAAFTAALLATVWGTRTLFLKRKAKQTKDSVSDWVN